MSNAKLFLVNHYHTDLELNLHLPKGRKVSVVGCRVPVGGMIDVCARLSLPSLEARAIVEASPDYITFYARSRMVELVEESSTIPDTDVKSAHEKKREELFETLRAQGVTPSGVVAGPLGTVAPEARAKLVELMAQNLSGEQDEPPRGGDPTPEIPVKKAVVDPSSLEPKLAATLAAITAEVRASLDEAIEQKAEAQASAAQPEMSLEPTVRSVIADTVPSTRWDKDALLAYAVNKGLDVNESMSKNALLRKIRGA